MTSAARATAAALALVGAGATAASPPSRRPQRGAFIVAFELSARRGLEFLWPHLSLPPFSEARVVLVVERMPQRLGTGTIEPGRGGG